jgi:hypothetical protein
MYYGQIQLKNARIIPETERSTNRQTVRERVRDSDRHKQRRRETDTYS